MTGRSKPCITGPAPETSRRGRTERPVLAQVRWGARVPIRLGQGRGGCRTEIPSRSRVGGPGESTRSRSFNREYPARLAAIIGAGLVALGAALSPDNVSWSVLSLGVMALVLATVAGLGAHGMKEREAYRRGGMAAVDAMTGRQFRALLEQFFVRQGYRVAPLGARGKAGADLLISDPQGRTIVQLKRSSGVVPSDAVQRAVVAKARYGVSRVLVVTSSKLLRAGRDGGELERCHPVEQGDTRQRAVSVRRLATSLWIQALDVGSADGNTHVPARRRGTLHGRGCHRHEGTKAGASLERSGQFATLTVRPLLTLRSPAEL